MVINLSLTEKRINYHFRYSQIGKSYDVYEMKNAKSFDIYEMKTKRALIYTGYYYDTYAIGTPW